MTNATLERQRHDAMAKKQAKRAGPGRPPKAEAERLDRYVTVRFAVDDHEFLAKASAEAAKPLSMFLRDAAMAEARRVLGETEG